MTSSVWQEKAATALIYVALGCLTLAVVYPFLHILSVSLSDRGEALRTGFHFYPRDFSLQSYADLFQYDYIWKGYGNTLFRIFCGTVLTLLVSVCAAYPLSRPEFPQKRLLTLLVLFTMIVDGSTMIVPNYLLMKNVGLLDTRWVYVLPYAANAFQVLVMLSFFRSMPSGLIEAAKMDGAREGSVLLRIVLPLSAPVLVTVGLWAMVFHINYFTDNLLYVSDKNLYVLQQIIREILIDNRLDDFSNSTNANPPAAESLKMAAVLVSVLPVLVLYPFMLRYFEQGTMIGSIKG